MRTRCGMGSWSARGTGRSRTSTAGSPPPPPARLRRSGFSPTGRGGCDCVAWEPSRIPAYGADMINVSWIDISSNQVHENSKARRRRERTFADPTLPRIYQIVEKKCELTLMLSTISVDTPSLYSLRRSASLSPSIKSIAIAPSRVASSYA